MVLNLSHNSLTSPLPLEVGKLENTNTLDISENNLSGAIPSSIDLSRNNLSGEILKDFLKLPFLLYLNLSFNDLEGELPSEGVFRNASAILVTGNNVCGGIPELDLPKCTSGVKDLGKFHAFVLTVTIVPVALVVIFVSVFLVVYWLRKSKTTPSSVVPSMDKLLKVSYRKLHQATNGFSSINLIGSGSFGLVYKAFLDDQQERPVAVKVLKLQQIGASKSFMANMSLEKWLHPDTSSENESECLDFLQRLNIAIDVASALHYLHDQCETPIVYCDLKPSNVLLDNGMVAHVSDFGLAKLLSQDQTNTSSTIGLKGSIGYTAPGKKLHIVFFETSRFLTNYCRVWNGE
ncbi:probable LRR receptor-like serine/threonine-protein kinase At3g47570 [Tripterygium wilfordii]|uniref:probable LRR receptor-like serine/threonine-protein kinase At3g47570 n=1 Tax=Tripterygium wilfordii TaxID=458696 RepID=UPI0018F8250F|nr:probable LRR receptor-like serine/threonine-protein kinase At3g47570 [Tripterygium wilfordii]